MKDWFQHTCMLCRRERVCEATTVHTLTMFLSIGCILQGTVTPVHNLLSRWYLPCSIADALFQVQKAMHASVMLLFFSHQALLKCQFPCW